MSDCQASAVMPAMAEHVFDEACDLRNVCRWLPNGLRVEGGDPPTVMVAGSAGDFAEQAEVHVHRDDMRLRWAVGDGRCEGWLQVTEVTSLTSEVTVCLSVHSAAWDRNGPAFERGLHQALERLADQVGRRMETTE
ncbi:SRPBCC family protein [Streptomyces sp. Wb2n-11]|uniref:SRPBCC family protein n=1 Tax=Streptomyces sp. Wb2n-11 TaxID=1030533 RepID=UPI000A7D8A49|nr:SRPBCC family protein [Streptomyces sp. Wb2n-11]